MYPAGAGTQVCGPGYEYYLIEEQIRGCAARVDELTGRIHQVQTIDWQSPAGQAFRRSLQEHRRSMGGLHETVSQAAASLRRLADMAVAQKMAERSGQGG